MLGQAEDMHSSNPMPLLSVRILVLALLVLCLSLLVDYLRSQCLHDGAAGQICNVLDYSPAAMSASLISLPASLIRQAGTRGVKSLGSPMRSHAQQKRFASNGRFSYRLGAASAGKRTPIRPPKLDQDFWTYTSTEENPSPPYLRSTKVDAGEDAFFATTVGGDKHNVAFGVADGVGGWQDQGVDPSHFSHGLCGLMAGTASTHEGLKDGKNVKPRDLMQTAYDAVIGNPRIVAGGCTASIGVADGQGGVETAKYVTKFSVVTAGINATFTVLETPAS